MSDHIGFFVGFIIGFGGTTVLLRYLTREKH